MKSRSALPIRNGIGENGSIGKLGGRRSLARTPAPKPSEGYKNERDEARCSAPGAHPRAGAGPLGPRARYRRLVERFFAAGFFAAIGFFFALAFAFTAAFAMSLPSLSSLVVRISSNF